MKNNLNTVQLKRNGFLPQRQKDLFSMRIGITGGQIDATHLRALADAAEKYGDGYVHITSRQGIEIPFINLNDTDAARCDMDNANIRAGVAGKRVRAVVACQGDQVCNHGLIDAQKIAQRLDNLYFGADVPYKFKIGITGCPSACLKPQENDLGIMGTVHPEWNKATCTECGVCIKRCKANTITKSGNSIRIDKDRCILCGECILACKKDSMQAEKIGYTIFVGGKVGRFPREGTKLVELFDLEKVYSIVDRTIDLYCKNGRERERLGDVIDRIGIDAFKKETLVED
ncbi:4Fe-4S binding protein [bacterium]|nr:4Fe-4S binding protein [bacterium]MBI9073659.1 4Fe-4S binding protein [Melioribacteraceae bacterium]